MDIKPVDILKWIGLVLAAGFIGYFGRYLSMLIIDRIHKRTPASKTADTHSNTQGVEGSDADKETAKLEKKRLKQQSKIAKKKGTL